jgi:hypothetical protein
MAKLIRTLEQAGIDCSSVQVTRMVSRDRGGEAFWPQLLVPGTEALDVWRRVRALVPLTGYWPLVRERAIPLRDRELALLEELPEGFAPDPDMARVLEEAARTPADPSAWPARMFPRQLPDWLTPDAEQAFLARTDTQLSENVEPNDRLTAILDYRTRPPFEPFAQVAVDLLPVSEGWQVPAFLQEGGWNNCPRPAEHAAMLKHWQERHGADVVVFGEVTELYVARPPQGRAELLELIKQHLLYGEETIFTIGRSWRLEEMAARLRGSHVWRFWWD